MLPDPSVPRYFRRKKTWETSEPLSPEERGEGEDSKSRLQRIWIYQKERFPLVKHGLLILIFSGAAVGYGANLTDTLPMFSSACVAFLSTFGFFWQMRVADEFKDLADDVQYRPYRPVPRGLVSLRELAILGLISAIIQASLALWLEPDLLGFLICIWAYFGLMCKEFFVRDWLKAHPVAYVLSHMVIVPLIGGYAVAAQTIPNAETLNFSSLFPFLIACFCNGLVIELGRKIRLPAGEEPGVETYSALWGLSVAVRLWLGAVVLTAIFSLWAAWQIDALAIVVPILAALMGWMGFKSWPFLGSRSLLADPQPSPPAPLPREEGSQRVVSSFPNEIGIRNSEQPKVTHDILDTPTALWTLGVYLSLGWLPLLLSR